MHLEEGEEDAEARLGRARHTHTGREERGKERERILHVKQKDHRIQF